MGVERFVKKYQVIIWLSFVIVIMSVVKITYRPPSVVEVLPIEEIIPTVTAIPTTASPGVDEIDEDYPLWELLPYKGKGFVVDHYVKPGVILVYLEGENKDEIKISVDQWMERNGVEPSSQTIEWRNK